MVITKIGINFHEKNAGRKIEEGDVLYTVRDTEWERKTGYNGTSYKVFFFDYLTNSSIPMRVPQCKEGRAHREFKQLYRPSCVQTFISCKD